SGENDCSQWATCNNTWASYKCVCQDGFIDNNPERPGRACQVAISMQGSLSVQCRVAAITVTIAKDFLLSAKIQESALYLGLRPCGVNGGNDTHVQLTVGWNECATVLVHVTSVTLFNTMDPYTSRIGAVEAPTVLLKCISVAFTAVRVLSSTCRYDMIKDVIVGLGSFQVTVQLMNGSVPLPHNYSLSPEQAVVVEVRLNTSSEQLKVVINKCWATPTQSPADAYSQAFLENSCSLNSYTKVLMNGNSSTSRVSVQIFSIVKLNVIYLHCQVQICIQIGSDTCVPVSTFYSLLYSLRESAPSLLSPARHVCVKMWILFGLFSAAVQTKLNLRRLLSVCCRHSGRFEK
uniref:ZP domain-containing protein n=1 Tax=Stegastes partitus TaxID=144197 RepID=A0A3B5A1A0_9TELE